MMQGTTIATRLLIGFFLALALAIGVDARAAQLDSTDLQQQAEKILKATGVQGGLIVHLGCGDGKLTAALGARDGYLVHGLERDSDWVDRARQHVQSLRLSALSNEPLYGKVSIEQWTGEHLPYADNLVSLVIWDVGIGIRDEEIQRVLAPGGVATFRQPSAFQPFKKPWPSDIDEWTHYLHDASGNAVGHDTVAGPPQRVQWVGGPEHARQHDHLASVSAMVSAKGRLFYIVDEGPIAAVTLPAIWSLIARDAFNGVELWKRPIPSWEAHLRRFRSGPTDLSRRLVAAGDRVYVTLGYDAAVSALDAATGQTVTTYEDTEGTEEIVFHEGVLYFVLGQPEPLDADSAQGTKGPWVPPKAGDRRLMAIEAKTANVLWTKADADTAEAMPLTLAVSADRAIFQNTTHVICLDRNTGRERWRHARPADPKRPGWSSPTLVVYEDVVLCGDRLAETKEPPADAARASREFWTFYRGGPANLTALSAETGEKLWECECAESFHAPVDVFVADGLVWTGQNQARWLGGELRWLMTGDDWYKEEPTLGRDPRTGEIKRRLMAGGAFTPTHHHRCYRNKATDRFMMLGRTGVEFIDLREGTPLRHNWIRGTCQYGIVPCNGLLYVTPHSCACYIQSKLSGLWALAAKESKGRKVEESKSEARLEKGPAYSEVRDQNSEVRRGGRTSGKLTSDLGPLASGKDWPTYRHDVARSGTTDAVVATELKQAWQTEVGGKLSALVAADGKVLVSQVDAHTVHAIDAESGERLWSYTAGGRVDSPPTAYKGRVLFGCADGWVYCLRAADGALAWRFLAAPEDRRIVAHGRIESVWPVPGSVLIDEDVAYFTAGRSSYLDGGMYLYRIDAETGEMLSETRLDSCDPVTGGQREEDVDGIEMAGMLPDVLSTDGRFVFLRDAVFDPQGIQQEQKVRHLYCPRGFLDDTWWHRTYWMYGTHFYSGAGGWPRAGREFPSGRILVCDDSTVYGFGRRREYYRWTTPNEYHLFATDKNPRRATPPRGQAKRRRGAPPWQPTWSKTIPLHARAIVLAAGTLFVAGPPDVADESTPGAFMLRNPLAAAQAEEALAAWQGKRGALLWAVSATDGSKLAEYQLEHPPVWDGMIAANGCLYVSTTDGEILCFTER